MCNKHLFKKIVFIVFGLFAIATIVFLFIGLEIAAVVSFAFCGIAAVLALIGIVRD